jgi:oligosaccharide repeat unit polymerase
VAFDDPILPGFRSLGTFRLTAFERATMAVLTAGTLLTLTTFEVTGFANGTFWFTMTVLAGLLLVPVMIGIANGRMDIFEPIFIVNAAYFLYLVWGPSVDWLAGLHSLYGTDIVSTIGPATMHAAVSVAAMLVGYYVRFGGDAEHKAKPPAPVPTNLVDTFVDPPRDRAAMKYTAGLAVGAIICLCLTFNLTGWNWTRLLTLGQYGEAITHLWLIEQNPFLNYLLFTIEWFMPALMIAVAFHKPRPRTRALIAFGFLLTFIAYTTLGFRYRILLLMVAPITYMYLLRRKRPGLGTLLFAGAALVLIIGGIAGTRRATRVGDEIEREMLQVDESRSRFANDLRIYPPYYALIQVFPTDHDFMWGTSYIYVFLSPIPRQLWAGKPDAPVVTVLRAVFGSRGVQQGLAYPNIGEMYVNFGLPGEILGMALFGFLLRKLWTFVRRNAHDRWALIWYALWFPFLVQVVSRGYFVQIAQEFAFIFLPVLVGRRFFGPASGLRQARARSAERLPRYSVGIPGR